MNKKIVIFIFTCTFTILSFILTYPFTAQAASEGITSGVQQLEDKATDLRDEATALRDEATALRDEAKMLTQLPYFSDEK